MKVGTAVYDVYSQQQSVDNTLTWDNHHLTRTTNVYSQTVPHLYAESYNCEAAEPNQGKSNTGDRNGCHKAGKLPLSSPMSTVFLSGWAYAHKRYTHNVWQMERRAMTWSYDQHACVQIWINVPAVIDNGW